MDPASKMNFDDGDDNSFGNNDKDMGGFNIFDGNGDICEADDFVVKDMDDVRKVVKVDVGYATMAKKVDVKILKEGLWTELESRNSTKPVVEETTN